MSDIPPPPPPAPDDQPWPPYAAAPGPAPAAGPVRHDIPNYLAWSIVVTIMCCWPFGIPAIIQAAKVDRLANQGRIAEALEASRKAKTWTMVSAGCGAAAVVLWFLFSILVAASGASNT